MLAASTLLSSASDSSAGRKNPGVSQLSAEVKRLQFAVHTSVPWYQRNYLVPGDLHSKMLVSLALDLAVAVETSERAEQARPASHACSAVPHSLSLSLSLAEGGVAPAELGLVEAAEELEAA